MGLRRAAAGILLLTALMGAAWHAQADFAAADGFSGRTGFDCTSCHVTPHPTAPPAEAFLEGLPATWTPGTSYPLTVRVEGGPPALPAPAPQGGFELDAEAGRLLPASSFEHLLRNAGPHAITYLPDGTLMREWQVVWQAPDLAERPQTLRFWLAAMAANGNHVTATNVSDGGETFDNVATLVAEVPADPAAEEAWRALPLTPPTVEHVETSTAGTRIRGQQSDSNATHLAFRVGAQPWHVRPAEAAWRIDIGPLAPGETLQIRAEGADRISGPVVALVGTTDGDARTPAACDEACTRATPTPPLLLLTGTLLFLTQRIRPCTARSC